MAIDAVLGRLDGLRETGRGRWIARCPAHDDRNPSLSIRELDDGRVLMHCFAGCDIEAVLAAIGLGLKDLFPEPLGHRLRPTMDRISAKDLARVLERETWVVVIAAEHTAQGIILPQSDRDRLLLAARRIFGARDAVS